MERGEPLIRDVTDTAMWTAAYRADESARRDAMFDDPYARRLAGDRGREIARKARPAAVRHGVVLRTAMLDRLIVRATDDDAFDTVLNLAAGYDTRPYRLGLPSALRWIEVDVPAVLDRKGEILRAETPRCALESVSLDLADRAARGALFDRVASGSSRTLVVTEGLLSYLDPEDVADLARDLRARSAFAVWLTDISSGTASRRVKNAGDDLKAVGRARAKFAPAESSAFFRPYGWSEVAYHGLFEEAPRLGRDSLTGRVLRGVLRVLPASARESFSRTIGIARLEQADEVP